MELTNKEHVNMLNTKNHIINSVHAKKTLDEIQNGYSLRTHLKKTKTKQNRIQPMVEIGLTIWFPPALKF